MSARKPNGSLFGLLLVGALGAGALSFYVSQPRVAQIPQEQRRQTREQEHGGTSVQVPKPKFDDKGDLSFEKEDKHVSVGENPYIVALNEFLSKSNVAPADAKVKSAVLEGKVLHLDFTAPFERTYGTDDERTLVNGILATAGQFRGVEQVRITVEGHSIDSLGSIELTDPLPVEAM